MNVYIYADVCTYMYIIMYRCINAYIHVHVYVYHIYTIYTLTCAHSGALHVFFSFFLFSQQVLGSRVRSFSVSLSLCLSLSHI